METKVCEYGCGRTFLRPIPPDAKSGLKCCEPCRKLKPKQRRLQYEAQRVREAGARAGVFV